MLAARAARTERVDLQILRVDFELDLFGLRQHGDGCGACVDAPLRLRFGHALDAVDAAFVAQPRPRPFPGNQEAYLLIAAELRFIRV